MLKNLLLVALCFIYPELTKAQTYTTDFNKDENPISEKGRWNNGHVTGFDWTDVRSVNGIACGTQTGRDTGYYSYNDSYAVLSGFPPDQTAEGVVHIANQQNLCNQEVELLLRWNSSPRRATGYECLFRCHDSTGFYMEIVRWNGALADFTYIARLHSSSAGIKDGDTLRATIKGNVITAFINKVQELQVTDNTYPNGNPGVGFFLRGCPGSNSDFGFSSFSATGYPVSKSGISIVSYLLRDRAVIVDSLVMRKCMYVAFKTGSPLPEVKRCAVAGTLSHQGTVMSCDTTWLFDEAAGNLGFNLPYVIPDGVYKLEIKIISPVGKILKTFITEYDRAELKPYFNREIQFWDFTTPYAHLECSGYGVINYHFSSKKALDGLKKVEISARMNSDNNLPAPAEAMLNGTSLGKFILPTGGDEKSIVGTSFENGEILKGASVREGDNQLTFLINPEPGYEGMGLRIYSHKNSTDPAVGPEIPITLTISSSASEKESFIIPVWGEEGEHITSKFSIPAPKNFTQVSPETNKSDLILVKEDVDQGFVIFNRHFLRYVYPWDIPRESERISLLGIRMSRNDFDPLTFCIYPIRDLGNVKISVSDLSGPAGKMIPTGNVLVQVARNMKIRTGEGNSYRLIPRLLDRTDHLNIPISFTTRFWLTVHADSTTLPGIYKGNIRIKPEKEDEKIIPVTVEVLPVTLEPVPGIDYNMLLSYEFFELESKDWSAVQKEKIYQDGVSSFKDYINHGMSTVVVASPYYFQWNKDGSPRLEHLAATIRAAKETGFKRPVFWYFGQYIQAAKGQHPGSIRLYDPKIHPARARFLVETALKIDKTLDGPPLGFMPIDEPRIALRQKITLDLFKEIKKVPGAVTMCTTNIGGKLLDIEDDSQVDRKPLKPGEKIRKSDRKVWEYNNAVVDCLNPGYSRYIYGYYTWRQNLDGMSSWGPSTTENSRGNPFEDLDHEFSDYAITYPHVGGPLATPNWEALREGIDDYRYIYQLEKLCSAKEANNPAETANAEKFLDSVRDMCDFDDRDIMNDFGKWTPERFESLRSQVIDWIMRLKAM